MVFSNLLYMVIAGFFVVQFFRQRSSLDGLGLRSDLMRLIVVWFIAMIVWGVPSILRIVHGDDDNENSWRYLNAQVVFAPTMAVSSFVTNGLAALATLRSRNMSSGSNGSDIGTDSDDTGGDASTTMTDDASSVTSLRAMQQMHRQLRRTGAARIVTYRDLVSVLVGARRPAFERFLASEYSLENLLLLVAVDSFRRGMGASSVTSPLRTLFDSSQKSAAASTSGTIGAADKDDDDEFRSCVEFDATDTDDNCSAATPGSSAMPLALSVILARKLRDDFVDDSAPNQVNVSFVVAERVRRKIRDIKPPPQALVSQIESFEQRLSTLSYFDTMQKLHAAERRERVLLRKLAAEERRLEWQPGFDATLFDELAFAVCSMLLVDVLPRFLRTITEENSL